MATMKCCYVEQCMTFLLSFFFTNKKFCVILVSSENEANKVDFTVCKAVAVLVGISSN